MGIIKDGGYSAIDKTSFGADSTDKSSFFTGKPYIEDLGYAFLFRNYRADLGKWQMRDLIGYPDGWNNLAYCNNASTIAFDLYGAILIYPDSIKTSIDILKKTATGSSIISQLEKSSHIHTINESSSGKGYSVSASNKANMSNPKSGGTGSTINMDNFNPNNTSPDDSGWSRPYELGLLHELAHAAEMDK